MPHISLEEVLRATGGKVLGSSRRVRIRRVCTDSRLIRQGDLFVALKGPLFDGHRFIQDAITRGALGAVVEKTLQKSVLATVGRVFRSNPHIGPLVVGVEDTLKAYQELASSYRSQFPIPVVAVTGSNGKTTSKDMISHVLARRWRILKTEQNFNNSIGVPQTLFRLTARHEIAVIEMGVDQRGQTARLCAMAKPTLGVITNIGPDHLEFFGTLTASAQSKAELLAHLPNDGVVVLNADDQFYAYLAKRANCRVVSYGFSPKADMRASDIVSDSFRTTFRLHLPGRTRAKKIRLAVSGHHNVSNALAGASIGHALGLSSKELADGLARFKPAPMRSQIRQWNGITFLYDCYNANPASMKVAVDHLAELGKKKRTIAVLGDMRELGEKERRFHRDIGAYVSEKGITNLIACGELSPSVGEGAQHTGMPASAISVVEDVFLAAQTLRGLIRPGDVVLLKGSRGVGMEKVFELLSSRSIK